MGLKNGVTTIKKPEIRINTRKKFLKTDRVRVMKKLTLFILYGRQSI